MTIKQFERAEKIVIECRKLEHERNTVGNILPNPSKQWQKWFDELRSKIDDKIKRLEKEFEEL